MKKAQAAKYETFFLGERVEAISRIREAGYAGMQVEESEGRRALSERRSSRSKLSYYWDMSSEFKKNRHKNQSS